jgi:hypothetical protein
MCLPATILLVKANNDETGYHSKAPNATKATGEERWVTALQPAGLGELMLNMHRYLILLDFSSPPFPSSNRDQTHRSIGLDVKDGS